MCFSPAAARAQKTVNIPFALSEIKIGVYLDLIIMVIFRYNYLMVVLFMKKIKYIMVLIIICFSLFNCSKQINISDDIISYGGFVGVVENNKIQFYENYYGFWIKKNRATLTLPNGYSSIFSAHQYIGIILEDKIYFYWYDFDNRFWKEDSRSKLTLPKEYKGVFDRLNSIGVILDNNKTQFYEYDYDNNYWILDSESDDTFPNEFEKVFGFFGIITGIVLNNKIIFYEYDYFNKKTWNESSVPDLILPVGYKNVFSIAHLIGVAIDNKIQLYENADHDSWKIASELKLVKK